MLRSTVYTHYIIYDVPAYKINATMKATDIIKTVHKIKINKTIKHVLKCSLKVSLGKKRF